MLRKLAGITIAALCLIGTAQAMAGNQHQCPNGETGVILIGTNGPQKLVGCPEKDYINGRGGNDHLWGGQDPDRILGGAGDDIIHAIDAQGNTHFSWEDDRADIVDGGAGYDTCYVSSKDVVSGCEVQVAG